MNLDPGSSVQVLNEAGELVLIGTLASDPKNEANHSQVCHNKKIKRNHRAIVVSQVVQRGTLVPGFSSGDTEEAQCGMIFECASEYFLAVPCHSDDDNDDVVAEILNCPDNILEDQEERQAIIEGARAFLNDSFGSPFKLSSDQDKRLSSDPTKYFSSVCSSFN